MTKLKKYRVRWEESHDVIVSAKNEEKAIEMMMSGKVAHSDENGEISVSPEAFEIKD